jgi:hypothetical protein
MCNIDISQINVIVFSNSNRIAQCIMEKTVQSFDELYQSEKPTLEAFLETFRDCVATQGGIYAHIVLDLVRRIAPNESSLIEIRTIALLGSCTIPGRRTRQEYLRVAREIITFEMKEDTRQRFPKAVEFLRKLSPSQRAIIGFSRSYFQAPEQDRGFFTEILITAEHSTMEDFLLERESGFLRELEDIFRAHPAADVISILHYYSKGSVAFSKE